MSPPTPDANLVPFVTQRPLARAESRSGRDGLLRGRGAVQGPPEHCWPVRAQVCSSYCVDKRGVRQNW